MASTNLDSESWRCAGPCHGQFIGKRMPDDICPRCVTLMMTTEPPKRQIVAVDHGGWISGPSATIEDVPAAHVRPGDRLMGDDGDITEVTDARHGWYWYDDDDGDVPGPGVGIGWKAVSGTSTGVWFRREADVLHRITP